MEFYHFGGGGGGGGGHPPLLHGGGYLFLGGSIRGGHSDLSIENIVCQFTELLNMHNHLGVYTVCSQITTKTKVGVVQSSDMVMWNTHVRCMASV